MSAWTRLRRWVSRHWLRLTITVVLTGLTINAWVQAGAFVLLILALSAIGCAIAVVVPGYVSGTAVVRHANHPDRRLEAAAVRRQIEAQEADR